MTDPTVEAEEIDRLEHTPFTGALLYCSCCCTVSDAERWGWNTIACPQCGTLTQVFVDPEIFAAHSGV